MSDRHVKDDAHWRTVLTDEQYRICRGKGTEPAFSGEYVDCKTPGKYYCRCCRAPLFDAASKFDSGSGWPSFSAAIDRDAVESLPDHSHGLVRTEIVCSQCACHLGHVFSDGPAPSGQRYCVNSASVVLNEPDPDES